mgnify:CR=1 FL=1
MRRPYPVLRALAALFTFSFSFLVRAAEPDRPNILLIVADDMGYGDLGAINGGISHTPVLDGLLAEGVGLAGHYAASPVCAPSRAGLLTAPLRSRFTLQTRLDYYDTAPLENIVRRSCGLLKVEIETAGAHEIAARSRGTPRVANNLINFVRDYAQERANGRVTRAAAPHLIAAAQASGGAARRSRTRWPRRSSLLRTGPGVPSMSRDGRRLRECSTACFRAVRVRSCLS